MPFGSREDCKVTCPTVIGKPMFIIIVPSGDSGAIVNNVWRNGERLWDRNSFVQGVYQQDITRKYGIKVNAKYAFDYTHYMNNDDKLMRIDNQYKQREVYVSVANKYSIFRNWDVSVAYDMQWNGLSEYMSADRYTHWISAATAFLLPTV